MKVRDSVRNTKKAVPNPKQNEKGKSKDAQNSTQNGVVCPGSSFQSNGGHRFNFTHIFLYFGP